MPQATKRTFGLSLRASARLPVVLARTHPEWTPIGQVAVRGKSCAGRNTCASQQCHECDRRALIKSHLFSFRAITFPSYDHRHRGGSHRREHNYVSLRWFVKRTLTISKIRRLTNSFSEMNKPCGFHLRCRDTSCSEFRILSVSCSNAMYQGAVVTLPPRSIPRCAAPVSHSHR